jgi:hypothetical protein
MVVLGLFRVPPPVLLLLWRRRRLAPPLLVRLLVPLRVTRCARGALRHFIQPGESNHMKPVFFFFFFCCCCCCCCLQQNVCAARTRVRRRGGGGGAGPSSTLRELYRVRRDAKEMCVASVFLLLLPEMYSEDC